MKTLSATFEVVTPMFLGGADQVPDGIRPASVKGALRFWWRAWAWSAIRAQHGNDLDALKALHRQESHLFGLAAKDGSDGRSAGGQGQFMLHVRHADALRTGQEQPFGTGFDNGILYLLGQGLGSFKGGNHCTRRAIAAPAGGKAPQFDIKLIFRPGIAAQDPEAITTAVKLFGLLGAMGSRARHGMGSVSMTALQADGQAPWQAPQDQASYIAELRHLLPTSLCQTAPPLSALSALGRIDISAHHTDSTKLLATVGREQQAYRSFGRDGMVNGQTAEQNFKADHDLLFNATQGNTVSKAPERTVFGLPHNYFFSSTLAKADVNYKPESGEGRRASPLLLHIHRIGQEHIAVHTLLRSQFLPNDSNGKPATIEIKSRGTQRVKLAEADLQWSVVHDYLNRFDRRETIHG